jgi:hypothetical protein
MATSPSFTYLAQLPVDCEHLFAVSPPVVLPDGLSADHVVAGMPMESIMGPDYSMQVFAADPDGRVIDWANPVWDATAGVDLSHPDWPGDWFDTVCSAFPKIGNLP